MLHFYYVDHDYAEHLRKYEPKVPNVDYDGHEKFFCGIVLQIGKINYYAPISHDTRRQQTNILIRDDDRVISSIKFSFMIPIKKKYTHRVDFDAVAKEDPRYANLLRAEHKFCSSHERELISKAKAVYEIGKNKDHALHRVCCDFRLLERKMEGYCHERRESKDKVV